MTALGTVAFENSDGSVRSYDFDCGSDRGTLSRVLNQARNFVTGHPPTSTRALSILNPDSGATHPGLDSWARDGVDFLEHELAVVVPAGACGPKDFRYFAVVCAPASTLGALVEGADVNACHQITTQAFDALFRQEVLGNIEEENLRAFRHWLHMDLSADIPGFSPFAEPPRGYSNDTATS